MSTYTDNQKKLAASPAGRLALEMRPGTRWVTPKGETVTIWLGWTPDVAGEAETIAAAYKWPAPSPDHNSEIGVTVHGARRGSTRRVNVADVAGWKPSPRGDA